MVRASCASTFCAILLASASLSAVATRDCDEDTQVCISDIEASLDKSARRSGKMIMAQEKSQTRARTTIIEEDDDPVMEPVKVLKAHAPAGSKRGAITLQTKSVLRERSVTRARKT
mmetsp:Transcript_113709/g.321553  ORF Transcript_113709/g.321553 Transcript_113709/m.321553 type:complete len:116 (-) Transcript_113709:92-439(-)